VFAAIWRSAAADLPERGGGARWVYTVAQAALRDRDPDPGVDDWLAFRVHAAVAELPEPERVPIELAYWEGRSRSEIAALIGVPPGTVETRTRSALTRLAERLEAS
jgi:RNA polymerase sigma-70 factor (ECF subfamily)